MYVIYKWTNKINGKGYVGLTNNPTRRAVEHKSPGSNCKALRLAMKKYGIGAFVFEILEDEISDKKIACKLEKYYIKKFRTREHGYNLTEGGDVGSGKKGEEVGTSKISEKQAIQILESPLSNVDIANKLGVSETIVSRVRRRITWKHLPRFHTTYRNSAFRLSKEQANEAINNPLSNTEIAKKFGVESHVIHKVRNGITWKDLDRSGAPNYQNGSQKITREQALIIINCSEGNLEIAHRFGLTKQHVYAIRKGKIWKDLPRPS